MNQREEAHKAERIRAEQRLARLGEEIQAAMTMLANGGAKHARKKITTRSAQRAREALGGL